MRSGRWGRAVVTCLLIPAAAAGFKWLLCQLSLGEKLICGAVCLVLGSAAKAELKVSSASSLFAREKIQGLIRLF